MKSVNELRKEVREAIKAGSIRGYSATDTVRMRRSELIALLDRKPIKPVWKEYTRFSKPIAPIYDTPIKNIVLETILKDNIPEPVVVPMPKVEDTEPEPDPDPVEPDMDVDNDSLAFVIASAVKKYLKDNGVNEGKVKEIINDHIGDSLKDAKARIESSLEGRMKAFTDSLNNLKPIRVETPKGQVRDVGRQHAKFTTVLRLASQRINVWMTGPSGSGKTHLAEAVAKALDVPFYAISVGLQTSKTDLFGYMDANGRFVESLFYRAYTNGGVFLLDEVDNGNANVLAMINAATGNSQCAFPSGMSDKHIDFVFLAAANTYGLGANAIYVGRNQIDGATRNRFAFIEIGYDEGLEDYLTANKEWLKTVRGIRRAIDEMREKVIASPRASIHGAVALDNGFTVNECLDMFIFQGVSVELKSRILSKAGV